MDRTTVRMSVAVVLVMSGLAHAAPRGVQVLAAPDASATVEQSANWKPAADGTAMPAGGVVANRAIVLHAQPGQPTVTVYAKAGGALPAKRFELAVLPAGAADVAAITGVEAAASGLKLTAGRAQVTISLDAGAVFAKVVPGPGAGSVEVRTAARYAVLPDFFADDTIYDAVRLKQARASVPAENFLLHLLDGGDAMVMCIWPSEKGKAGAAEPRVDLLIDGQGEARRLAATRIEFLSRTVSVGLMEHKGIWHDQSASSLPACKSTPLDWNRPFEGRWRGTFIVAADKVMADWPTRQQSFDFKQTGNPKDRFWRRGDANAPQIWQESLGAFLVYPAIFNGEQTRLNIYADRAEQNKAQKATAEARKTDKSAPAVAPANVYERVLIYPLDRAETTPTTVFTPVDLMRQTLGQGPCEYVLDLAGVKPREAGGDRKILSYATCGLWDEHIGPILHKAKQKKNPEGGIAPLDAPTKAHLVQALEDMWHFVRAVHDRLREYKAWGVAMAEFVDKESASPKKKALADAVRPYVDRLNKDVGRLKFEGPGTEGYWKVRIEELISQVKADKYDEVASIATIRNLGNHQDQMVSRCRQYVKGIRQAVALFDAADPEVRKFAAELQDRCQNMLRNMHPKEGF